ncbi:hypothetical protein H0X48_01880 [Candidatus Dependentiae bacterium]|nr:hypothetical protein [Candidatus Dependentiae bacterium]
MHIRALFSLFLLSSMLQMPCSFSMQTIDPEAFNSLLKDIYGTQEQQIPIFCEETQKKASPKLVVPKPLTLEQKLSTLPAATIEQIKAVLVGASIATVSLGALNTLYYLYTHNFLGCVTTLATTGALEYSYSKLYFLFEPHRSLQEHGYSLAEQLVKALQQKPKMPTIEELQAELFDTWWQSLDQKQIRLLPELALVHAARTPRMLLNEREFTESLNKRQTELLTELIDLEN